LQFWMWCETQSILNEDTDRASDGSIHRHPFAVQLLTQSSVSAVFRYLKATSLPFDLTRTSRAGNINEPPGEADTRFTTKIA